MKNKTIEALKEGARKEKAKKFETYVWIMMMAVILFVLISPISPIFQIGDISRKLLLTVGWLGYLFSSNVSQFCVRFWHPDRFLLQQFAERRLAKIRARASDLFKTREENILNAFLDGTDTKSIYVRDLISKEKEEKRIKIRKLISKIGVLISFSIFWLPLSEPITTIVWVIILVVMVIAFSMIIVSSALAKRWLKNYPSSQEEKRIVEKELNELSTLPEEVEILNEFVENSPSLSE